MGRGAGAGDFTVIEKENPASDAQVKLTTKFLWLENTIMIIDSLEPTMRLKPAYS